jgi:hypothetical protein
VHDDRHAVGGDADIELDGVAAKLHGALKRRQSVLRLIRRSAAMCDDGPGVKVDENHGSQYSLVRPSARLTVCQPGHSLNGTS